MTSLLERVRFLSPEAPEQEPATEELPLLDQDPEPAPAVRKPARNQRPAAAKPMRSARNGGKFVSKTAVEKGVADEIDLWLKVMAGMWSLSDETCSAVLNETSSVIAADLAKLAARSDWLMERFEGTSLIADIGKTMVHLAPLVRVAWKHHGPGSRVEQEEEMHDAVPVVDPNQYGPWRPSVA